MKGVKGRREPQPPSPRAPKASAFVPPVRSRAPKEVLLGKRPSDQALLQDGKKLKAMNDEIKELEADLSEVKGARELLSTSIYQRMLKAKIESIKLTGIGTMSALIVPFPHIIPGLEDKAFAALEKLGYGASIKRTIHAQSLKSLVKELRAHNIHKVAGLEIYDKGVARIYANSGKKKEE